MSEELSRRALLRNIAISATLSAGLDTASAQHVHQMAAEEAKAGGAYRPKTFTDHEWAVLRRLCDLAVPGSLQGGAPEFIDLLSSGNDELAAIFTGGIGWLDHEMERRYGHAFDACSAEQQTSMLDLIAWRKNTTPDLAPGIHFFDWLRRLTVDAYYTSKPGIAELGFMGNRGQAKFEVPAAVLDYATKRSGLT